MPTRFEKNPNTRCPLFYKETTMEIKCKDRGCRAGGVGLAGESTVSCFATKEDKCDHKADFCNGVYQGCEVYRALMDMMEYRGGA